MKRELEFITVCPIDTYFTWQVHLWLESLRELNLSDKATVLLFEPIGRPKNPKWDQVINLYPESKFFFYKDDGTAARYIGRYIPILRPYTMAKYCKDHPEIENKAVFYCDSDILFLKDFNIDHLLSDDIIYGSDTNSYINASYFDSKIRDVLPEKLEDYKKIDVLEESAKIVGINRQICEAHNAHSIGTQYLLKETNEEFWINVFNKCIPLLNYLGGINRQYFPNENKGFQKWTSDMWLVLWEIWRKGQDTRVVKELEFSWATDNISRINTTTIFHNAGVVSDMMSGVPYFYKGKYHSGNIDPTKDPHFELVLNNEESKKRGTWYYASKLKELSQKYKLSY